MGTVAFTGYRPNKLPFAEDKKDELYLAFRKRLRQVIDRLVERGYTEYVSGVAMGFDTWVAEDVIEVRKNNPNKIVVQINPNTTAVTILSRRNFDQ